MRDLAPFVPVPPARPRRRDLGDRLARVAESAALCAVGARGACRVRAGCVQGACSAGCAQGACRVRTGGVQGARRVRAGCVQGACRVRAGRVQGACGAGAVGSGRAGHAYAGAVLASACSWWRRVQYVVQEHARGGAVRAGERGCVPPVAKGSASRSDSDVKSALALPCGSSRTCALPSPAAVRKRSQHSRLPSVATVGGLSAHQSCGCAVGEVAASACPISVAPSNVRMLQVNATMSRQKQRSGAKDSWARPAERLSLNSESHWSTRAAAGTVV